MKKWIKIMTVAVGLCIMTCITTFAATTTEIDCFEVTYEPGYEKAYIKVLPETSGEISVPETVEIDGVNYNACLANSFLENAPEVTSVSYSGNTTVQNSSEHGPALAFLGSNASGFITYATGSQTAAQGGVVTDPTGAKIYHVGSGADIDSECSTATSIDEFAYSSPYEFAQAYKGSTLLQSITHDKVMKFSYGSGSGSSHVERDYSGFVLNGENAFCLDVTLNAPSTVTNQGTYGNAEKQDSLNALFAAAMPVDAFGIFEDMAAASGLDYGTCVDAALSVAGNYVWEITNGRSFDLEDIRHSSELGGFLVDYVAKLDLAYNALKDISLSEKTTFREDGSGFLSNNITVPGGCITGFDPYSCADAEILDYADNGTDLSFKIRTDTNPEGRSFEFQCGYAGFDVYQSDSDTQDIAVPYVSSITLSTIGTFEETGKEPEPIVVNDTPELEGIPVYNDLSQSSSSYSSIVSVDSSAITFAKKAMDTKELLEGAAIIVTNQDNGVIVEQFLTGSEVKTMDYPDGRYLITEITAPAGYEIAEPIQIEISGGNVVNRQSNSIVMYDMPLVSAIETPKTGDSSTMVAYALITGGCFLGFMLFLILRKRRTR